MKRKVRIALAAAASISLLAACQRQESLSAENQSAAAADTEAQSMQDPEKEVGEENNETSGQTVSKAVKRPVSTGGQKNKEAGPGYDEPVVTLSMQAGGYYTYEWDDENERMIASINVSVLHVGEKDREKYPKLEAAVTAFMDERVRSREEIYQEAIIDGAQAYRENPEFTYTYEVEEKVSVRRADTRVLSLMLDGYYYVGGAYGAPYSMGAVFDTRTGEKLELEDVVTDVSRVPDLVKEQLGNFWEMDMLYEDLDLNKFFAENSDSIQWTLDYNGITFYFNPYDIAPYASGMQIATISFSEHPEIVKAEYREVPESYGMELSFEKPCYFDADNDGTLDEIVISAAESEYGGYDTQSVFVNGVWYQDEYVEAFTIDPVLVHTADGRNYIYIENQGYNDYRINHVYDVNGGFPQKVGTVDGGLHYFINMEEDYDTIQVLTDPDNFVLDTRTYLLGTADGHDTYHVDADGLPVKATDWYIINYNSEFTLMQDLTVPVVNEAGYVNGEYDLKKGDKVVYYRTDGEEWGDVILPDGRIGRVITGRDDWMITVNGVYVEDVFDGLIFAG